MTDKPLMLGRGESPETSPLWAAHPKPGANPKRVLGGLKSLLSRCFYADTQFPGQIRWLCRPKGTRERQKPSEPV